MKKLFYIIFALFTFVCGILVFYVQPLFTPIRLNEFREISALYVNKKIQIKGYLEVSGKETPYSYSLVDKDRKENDLGELRPFMMLEISKSIEEINISWLKELAQKNNSLSELRKNENYSEELSRYYYAEVEITGRVRERKNEFFGGNYFVVEVEDIKQVSPVTLIYLKDFNK